MPRFTEKYQQISYRPEKFCIPTEDIRAFAQMQKHKLRMFKALCRRFTQIHLFLSNRFDIKVDSKKDQEQRPKPGLSAKAEFIRDKTLIMGQGSKFFDIEDDGYEFSGSEELKKVAEEELRETESLRTSSLKQLRECIKKHPDIKKCRTDSAFLLRFLRTKKFSVPLALAMIERYLAIRQLYPQWFRNLKVDDPVINDIIDKGYLVPLSLRDEQGRKVIFSCPGRFDPYKYTAADMTRTHSLIVECLMDNEENQIRGYTYVNDESGLSMGHISLWSLSDMRSLMKCIQNSTPMRHKSTHFINVPHYANKVFEFFLGLLSDKLKGRVMTHNSLDDFKEHISPKILPKEYGGEVPLKNMIDQFKTEMKKQREAIAALDEMEIDISKKSKIADLEDELTGVAGSFRKLEVD